MIRRRARRRDADWAQQSEEIRRARETRRRALAGREALVAEVSAILFEADPAGINFGDNTDEYDSEAETIVLRLGEADGPGDVERIAHEEFVRWFDDRIAGPRAGYAGIARAIWAAAHPGPTP